jgi:hypothetical protein
MDARSRSRVEENDRREQPGPLVPVDERVVFHEVKEVGCRHRKQPFVGELASEGGLRLRDGGLEEAAITEPGSPCGSPGFGTDEDLSFTGVARAERRHSAARCADRRL